MLLVVVTSPVLAQQRARVVTPAHWDDSFGLPGLDGVPVAHAVFDDGMGPKLYLGGSFDVASTLPADDLVRWNGADWEQVPIPAYTPSGNRGIEDLCVFDDGAGAQVVAGGDFTYAGNEPASRIASWNGAVWSTLGAGVDGRVSALAALDEGQGIALFAGGSFTSAGDGPANHVARWFDGDWSALGNGTNAEVRAFKAKG